VAIFLGKGATLGKEWAERVQRIGVNRVRSEGKKARGSEWKVKWVRESKKTNGHSHESDIL
jgi:hypothetical protein